MTGPRAAPPVLLLHSIATRGDMWAPQIGVWSSRFRLIVPDLPGHGQTLHPPIQRMEDYADALAELLDDLALPSVAIVGLSLGGMIGQAFALRHPQRLSALVLAQTSAHSNKQTVALWEQRMQAATEQGMRAQVPAFLQRWFTAEFLQSAPLTTRWIADMIAATPLAGYLSAAAAIQRLDHLALLGTIATPTLVVAGAEDKAIPPDAARAMCSHLPHARMSVIERAAHLANVEQPVAFSETVGQFLDQSLGTTSR
ncbi:MAG: alpha/beta fold hydrolase [Pseudomonadota bacterium]